MAVQEQDQSAKAAFHPQLSGTRAHERWRVDHRSKTVVLEGLMTVCMPVHMLLHWLQLSDLATEASTSERQSSCLTQMDELSAIYGDKALEVALLAGGDALRFCNSLYMPGNPEQPRIKSGRSWSLLAVQEYATQMWCATWPTCLFI
jgi:hypothetical protein